jgi:Fe-Mn family superoxide dismutase
MRLLLFLFVFSITIGVKSQEFSLPELRFEYGQYEQGIDEQTMRIHHSKHHQGYVNKLNKAVQAEGLQNTALIDLLLRASDMPGSVRNNSGGHYNHTLFWEVLTPTLSDVAPGKISEELSKQIESDFESFEALRKELTNAAAKRFGSGWAWLIVMPDKTLKVTSSANQDNPIMDVSEIRGIPILGIDVWEHAYYLRYQNKRGDYLSAIWSLLDWGLISEKYKEALKDPLLKRIN